MDYNHFWNRIDLNCQNIAERDELVEDGENFKLTNDQQNSLHLIDEKIHHRAERMILKGPTGCGKTEVWMRMAICQYLETGRPVWVLAPTRDLLRQHMLYISERLEGTKVKVTQIHGGVAPRDR